MNAAEQFHPRDPRQDDVADHHIELRLAQPLLGRVRVLGFEDLVAFGAEEFSERAADAFLVIYD